MLIVTRDPAGLPLFFRSESINAAWTAEDGATMVLIERTVELCVDSSDMRVQEVIAAIDPTLGVS